MSVLIRHFAEYIYRVSTTRYYVDVHKPSPSLAQSACLLACLPYVRNPPILGDPTSLNAVDGWLSKDYRHQVTHTRYVEGEGDRVALRWVGVGDVGSRRRLK